MENSKGEKSRSPFLSLPNDIILSCLARIPNTYYPELCLVSKTFRDLIFSKDLAKARSHLKTNEECLFLCVKLPTSYHPVWFSLYKNKNTGNLLVPNLLVPLPSSYTPYFPKVYMPIGSHFYTLEGGISTPSSVFKITNNLNQDDWRMIPSMKVARMNTVFWVVHDEKLYVMGGCDPSESTHWAEVFDLKTQTWEPLPDPGHELRNCTLKKIHTWKGKLYVITTGKKHYAYYMENGTWDEIETQMTASICTIDGVRYLFGHELLWWEDPKLKEWVVVEGLDMLGMYDEIKNCIVMANYGGKLLMFWESPNEEMLCSVITLERRQGEVWGHIESTDELKLPDSSSILLRCVVTKV